ncbi:MAG: VWA domain-containing protein, partial [Planctomycetota bacterium]|nr:VWA domain-containing protein [Planctomycetota bacterium]
ATMKIGTVADWTEAHRYCQLVVDAERAYMPIAAGTTLPEAPRFLPDVMTGGRVVFLAPDDAKSLELRCDFPNAKKPDGQVIRPRGVLLALEGKRPSLPAHKPILSISDDVYRVSVTGQATPDTFAGAKAPDGKRLLVLDVLVENVGPNGELFQTKEQLKCATSDGAQAQVHPLTYEGVYRPTELVFIPSHERRTFQVAYAIPATETRPRLAYGGISLAKNLDLRPIEVTGAAVAANPAPSPVAPSAPAPAAPAPTAVANAPVQPAPTKPPFGSEPQGQRQAADAPKPQVAVNVPPQPELPKPAPAKPLKTADVQVLRVPAKQPHEPNGIAGVGLKPEQVNQSIERGAAFLWNYIKENDVKGSYEFGYRQEHMLAALALVHADAHKKFPDFDATVRNYIATFDPLYSNGTYLNGLYCMLIEAYGDPTYLPQMRTTAQWLLDTQGPDGMWGYGIHLKQPPPAVAVRRVLQVAGGRPLDQPAGGEPLVRKTKWEEGADGDNSVTQYALLGLHAAARFEVKIPEETWERTLKEHRKRQDEEEGGFAYTTGGPSHTYGSMTCAGICALALARHETGVKDFAEDEGIERGLAWMSNYFTVEGNPHPAYNNPKALGTEWHYYYLYSLERVGRILDTEFIGPHEWYPLGAKFLLSKQRGEDGGWVSKTDRDDPVLSTSFALLFLTRATASLDLPKRAGPGTLKTQVIVPAGQKVYIILDCSGTMMEEVAGRPRFDIAREALVKLVGDMPSNAHVALRAFGHSKSAIQPGADEDTELIVSMGVPDPRTTLAKLQALRPRGKTPLARTLIGAAGDLRGAAGDKDRPITVLLVTDGGDDNTKPPKTPLQAAAALAELPNLQLYVVGFDVQRADWVEQLTGLARSGGGQYLAAADGAALHREMKMAVLGLPESFSITDVSGKPAGGGEFGKSVPLPEGKYTFRTDFAGKAFEEPFWINAGSPTAVTFDAAQVAKEQGVADGSPAAPKAPVSPPPVAADAAPGPAPAAGGNKFCTSCGTKLAAAVKFCTNCGAKQ